MFEEQAIFEWDLILYKKVLKFERTKLSIHSLQRNIFTFLVQIEDFKYCFFHEY